MSKKSGTIPFKFKVQQTSKGYLAQGYEIADIIVESETEEQLNKDLDSAIDCYFESFPEQKSKFVITKSEKIIKLNKQI